MATADIEEPGFHDVVNQTNSSSSSEDECERLEDLDECPRDTDKALDMQRPTMIRTVSGRQLTSSFRTSNDNKRELLLTNEDGSEVAIPVHTYKHGLSPAQMGAVKTIFDSYDTDHSGQIDVSELGSALGQLRLVNKGAHGNHATALTKTEISKILTVADVNNDGEISFEEFCTLVAPAMHASDKAGVLDAASTKEQVMNATRSVAAGTLGFKNDVDRIRAMVDNDRWVINPHGKFMRTWDQVTIYSLLFIAVVTPAEIAFTEATELNALFYLNRMFDLVFFTDIIVQLFLAFPDPSLGNRLVKDLRIIRQAYYNAWFGVDVISIMPFDIVGMVMSSKGVNKLRVVRLVRLLRLIKMLRMFRGSRILQRWECDMAIPYWQIGIGKILVYLVLFAHWCACVWGMTANVQSGSTVTWLDVVSSGKYFEHTEIDSETGLSAHNERFDQYCLSLYFAVYTLTSIGYGDVAPQNRTETLICTCMMMIASIFWAYTVGTFCSLVSNMDFQTIEFRQRLDQLNFMLTDLNIPQDMRRNCRIYFYQSRKLRQMQSYRQMQEQDLSHLLRSQLREESYIPSLMRVWFLRLCSKDFLHGLVSLLEPRLFAPTELLNMPNTLFINLEGVAAKLGKPMGKGAVWGVDFLLDRDLIVENTFASALTFVEVLTLERHAVAEIVSDFPDDQDILMRARNFYNLKNKLLTWAIANAPKKGIERVIFKHRELEREKKRKASLRTKVAPNSLVEACDNEYDAEELATSSKNALANEARNKALLAKDMGRHVFGSTRNLAIYDHDSNSGHDDDVKGQSNRGEDAKPHGASPPVFLKAKKSPTQNGSNRQVVPTAGTDGNAQELPGMPPRRRASSVSLQRLSNSFTASQQFASGVVDANGSGEHPGGNHRVATSPVSSARSLDCSPASSNRQIIEGGSASRRSSAMGQIALTTSKTSPAVAAAAAERAAERACVGVQMLENKFDSKFAELNVNVSSRFDAMEIRMMQILNRLNEDRPQERRASL